MQKSAPFIVIILMLVAIGAGAFALNNNTAPSDSPNDNANTNTNTVVGLQNESLTNTSLANDIISNENENTSVQTNSSTNTSPNNSSSTTTSAEVKTITVTAEHLSYDPKSISVKRGDKVKIVFKNNEGTHDLRIDEFNVTTKMTNAGDQDTVEFTADKAGSFEYYCSFGNHRAMGMWGTLIVQ